MRAPKTQTRWTDEHVASALRMRGEGHGWKQIADALGKTAQAVKSKLKLSVMSKEERRAYNKSYLQQYKAKGITPAGGGRDVKYVAPEVLDIPSHVIAERDRALRDPPSLSTVLLGDPLPGRSALDRMGRL